MRSVWIAGIVASTFMLNVSDSVNQINEMVVEEGNRAATTNEWFGATIVGCWGYQTPC